MKKEPILIYLFSLFFVSAVLAQDIVQVEYFWDTDPGLGNGTPVSVTADSVVTLQFTPADVPEGFHTLYLRAKNETGNWGIPHSHPFFKKGTPGLPDITTVDYFFRTAATTYNSTSYTDFTPTTNIDVTIPVDPMRLDYDNYLFIQGVTPTGIHGFQHIHQWTVDTEQYPLADLEVTNVQATEVLSSGQTFEVSWQVTNTGNEGTNVPHWQDKIYLMPNPDADLQEAGVVLLGAIENVSYLTSGESYTNHHEFVVPLDIEGDYYLSVYTDADRDLAEAHGLNNIRQQIVTINRTPIDLQVTDVTSPATATAGQNMVLSWTVENHASGRTMKPHWSDAIYASSDTTFSQADDRLLAVVPHTGFLDPYTGYTVMDTLPLPHTLVGTYFLFVVTDTENDLYEYNAETNNIRRRDSLVIAAGALPDLAVTAVSIPDTAVYSGQAMLVEWTVQNQGERTPYEDSWTDALYLSPCPTFDPDSLIRLDTLSFTGELAPNESYSDRRTERLPEGIFGDYYLFVHTNWQDQVFEYTATANNIARSETTVHINLSPWADLQVDSVWTADTSLVAGQTITVNWVVRNAGSAATAELAWQDQLYLSPSAVWDTTGSILLDVAFHFEPLDTAVTRTQTASVTLPPDISGTYYLYSQTDAANIIYEHTAEDNNITRSVPLSVQPYPPVDLAIRQFTAPASGESGQPINLTWQVMNIGAGNTLASVWSDGIYLSADTLLSVETDLSVTTRSHIGGLAAGQAYERQLAVDLPDGIAGDFYLFAQTDVAGAVQDKDPTNNVIRAPGPITVTLSPSPDLVVQPNSAARQVMAGQPVSIHWSVENNGMSPTPANWYDGFYLSPNPLLDENDIRLGSIPHRGVLDTGMAYHDSLTVEIPVYLSGRYYALIHTDSRNDIYEHEAEDNNIAAIPLDIVLAPPVDLEVTHISHPDSAISGEETTITWQIQNLDPTNRAEGMIRDAVYLSADSLWSAEDPLIGYEERYIDLAPGERLQVEQRINPARILRDNGNPNGTLVGETPGVIPGSYSVIVRTNIRNDIRESHLENNLRVSSTPVQVQVETFSIGDSVETTLTEGQVRYYQMEVDTPNRVLDIGLTSDAQLAMNEIYIAYNRMPSLRDYDLSGVPFAANQRVFVPVSQTGSYYILLIGRDVPEGIETETIRLQAVSLDFSISRINPPVVGGLKEEGEIIIRVDGVGFQDSTQVMLRREEQVLEPAYTTILNPTQLRAIFPTEHLDLGFWDVVVTLPEGTESVIPSGLLVEPSDPLDIQLSIQGPDAVRLGRNGLFTVGIHNPTNINIPAGALWLETQRNIYFLVEVDSIPSPYDITEDDLEGITGWDMVQPVPTRMVDDTFLTGDGFRKRAALFFFYNIPPGDTKTMNIFVMPGRPGEYDFSTGIVA
ncbi:MAG: hypothetical protein D6675_06020, partial [Gemmatimonadetes bacterium]